MKSVLISMQNEMRDRLVEMLNETFDAQYTKSVLITAEHTADHLIENGVVVPPCKVGDSCYPLEHSRNKPIVERKVSRITFSQRNIIIGYYENDGQYRPPLRTRILGEDVFPTKAEAEQKLKEMRGENG